MGLDRRDDPAEYAGKTAEQAVDLNCWADLLDGVGMLEARRGF